MARIIGNLRCLYRRLFFRISVNIFLIIIIPAAVILVLLAYNLRENIRDVTLSKFEEGLKNKADMASANFDFIEDDLSSIAKHLEQHFSGLGGVNDIAYGVPPRRWYRAAKFKNLMDDLETMLLMNRGFLKVRVINNSGHEIVRFDRTATGIKEVPFEDLEDKSDRDYFINAMAYPAGKVYLHPVTLETERGKIIIPHTPVIRISRKIMASDGRVIGIIVLTVSPDTIFGPQGRNDGTENIVIDETGAYQRHSGHSMSPGSGSSQSSNIFDEIPQLKINLGKKDAQTIFDGARGEYRVWRKVFYREDDSAHYWVFLERHPEFSIVSGYTDVLIKKAAILAFVVCMGFLLVGAVIFKALLPLTDIAEAIRKREAGDMTARAPAAVVENEIGEIAAAFNGMSDRLNRTILDLQKTMALKKSVSDISPAGQIIADGAGTIISVNPAANQMFGYLPDEMIGKNVKMLAPSFKEDEYSKFIQDYLNFKKTGLPEKRKTIRAPKEAVSVKKSGEFFYISVYVKEVPVADEDVFVGIMEDITERRAAKIALTEEMENSKAIMNASNETLALIGLEGNLISINDAGAKRLNANRADLVGKSLYQILPLELALNRMKRFEEVARTGRPVVFEDERSGKVLLNSIYPVIDKNAQVMRCALFAVDITERKQWERSLAEKEAKLRAILASVPDAVILIDEKGIVELFNPAGSRIFGWAAEDMLDQNIKMLMPEPFQSDHDRYLENYIRSGVQKTLVHLQEVTGLRMNGARFPAELFVTELWLGASRKFLGIIRDISDRRLAEESLKLSHEDLRESYLKYSAIMDHVSSVIYTVDINGEPTFISNEAEAIMGPCASECFKKGHLWDDIVVKEDMAKYLEFRNGVLASRETQKLQYRIMCGDGNIIWLEDKCSPITDHEGKLAYYQGIADDITALKNLEKMKDDFFHAVVHDLKSPITGIKLELDMLADQIVSFSSECSTKDPCRRTFNGYETSLKGKIADIGEGIDQLHLMIQSLLKLGEIEEEKLELQYEAFGMNDLFGELERDFRGRAAAKGVAMEFSNSFTGTVIADFKLLKRVLQNLVDNAVKYSIPNTKISVNAISSRKDVVENIIISVANTGEPLTGAKINSLFQKFKTHGHAESGSGIGLFFCYKTMNLLVGGIYVDQDANMITFHAFFPNG